VARVRAFGSRFARLCLREPLPLHVGDRLLLRDPGAARPQPGAAHRAAGPGSAAEPAGSPAITGATVLDVSPPAAPRRGAAAAVRRELAGWPDPPRAEHLLRRRGLARPAELRAMGLAIPASGSSNHGSARAGSAQAGTAQAGTAKAGATAPRAATAERPTAGSVPVTAAGWLADPAHWAQLRERLGRAVAEHAARDPLAAGMPLEAARAALGLPDRQLVEALAAEPGRAASGQPLTVRDGYVRAGAGPAAAAMVGDRSRSGESSPAAAGGGTDAQALPAETLPAETLPAETLPAETLPAETLPADTLPAPVASAVRSLRAELAASPFRAPEAGRLRELGLDRKAIAAAARAGLLLRITPELVLAPGADVEAARVLARLPQPFTTAQARQALDTTRRVAIPLLEYLDRALVTQRLPDDRRMLRSG
jgi:selenocysteine-specific elongation factor